VADKSLAVDPFDERSGEALFDLFGRAATPGTGDLAIEWRARPLALPPRQPDVRGRDTDFWLDESGVTAAHRSGVAGTVVGDAIRIGGDVPSTARALRMAVQLPLCQLLGRSDRHVVHGALLRRDRCALVVAGPSGSGKSTASFAAARSGWDVLSDDMTVLATVDGRVVAWGLPKPLHVPDDVLEGRDLQNEAVPDDDRRRRLLPPPPVPDAEVLVSGVVLVGHSVGGAELAAGPSGIELVQTLLRMFPVATTAWGTRQVFPTVVMTSRLSSVEIRHDADPGRRVEAAARLLDEVAGRWSEDASSGGTGQ
jgi:hypothetical protein